MDEKWTVLEEQSRRFALDKNRPIDGRLRISGRQVFADVHNLRPATSGYKLFFIGRKNDRSVYKIIGDITPDRQGTAVLRTAVDTENMDGEGIELSCFYIYMVAAMTEPIQPVLKGDLIKLQAPDQSYQDSQQPYRPLKPQNAEAEGGNMPRTYNGYYSAYIRQKTGDLMNAAGTFEDISPFGDRWLSDNWKRVTDSMKFPAASVGAEQQIRKYGHFIFATEEAHFYLAVPGRHTEEDWPDRGKSGFVMWQSIRGSDEYGYWAMVIDCKTGIITEIS